MYRREKSISFFEFWPTWLIYLPVILQWVIFSLYYRSFTLPLLANPSLTLSGMVGVAKSELLIQAKNNCQNTILSWISHITNNQNSIIQAGEVIKKAKNSDIDLPFICKPDIGCRGSGVKFVKTLKDLSAIINSYPIGTSLLCQKLASHKSEAGIFYVKDPKTQKCNIISLAFKNIPQITGNGINSLGQLIENDKRASLIKNIYYKKHKEDWGLIPKKGEVIDLLFAASHSKGAIFLNAQNT